MKQLTDDAKRAFLMGCAYHAAMMHVQDMERGRRPAAAMALGLETRRNGTVRWTEEVRERYVRWAVEVTCTSARMTVIELGLDPLTDEEVSALIDFGSESDVAANGKKSRPD